MHFEIDSTTNLQVWVSKTKNYLDKLPTTNIIKTQIATIVSELIYNIQKYTPRGYIDIKHNDLTLHITAKDYGSGIKNLDKALLEGYSTGGTLGLGLPAIIRLSDDFTAETSENGTIIRIQKKLI